MLSPVADFKIFGMNIVLILNSLGAVFCILFLIVNRFSILVRRLKFLKMNVYYCLLIFIPLVGFILDFYLMTVPDDVEQD